MAGHIPPEFINELLQRTDLVAVVAQRVPLRQSGKEYSACCPFHQEKTPSFSVSPIKQFYHCFGCGAHGSAISFLMHYEGLDFRSAVEELARAAGLSLPDVGYAQQQDATAPLFAVLQAAQEWFKSQLREHPQRAAALDYLSGRGLNDEIMERYGVGFAPAEWHGLLELLRRRGFGEALQDQAGLLAQSSGRRYDRFRDRVMFPIQDIRGRVLGFGGRMLGDQPPKYLNSPETPVFRKGEEVYGLFQARQTLKRDLPILIMEGYMDVIAVAQAGIPQALATLGTATSAHHVEKVLRYTDYPIFCFDGDAAGRKAAWKALETALPYAREGREFRFLWLPEGEDPDSLIRREGAAAFRERFQGALRLTDYLFAHLQERYDTRSLEGKAALAGAARPLLDRLPEGPFKALVLIRMQEITQVTGAQLGLTRHHQAQRSGPAAEKRPLSVLGRAVAMLLQFPASVAALSAIDPAWRELPLPGIDVLVQLVEQLHANPRLSTAALLEQWRDTDYADYLGQLAAQSLGVPEDGVEAELCGSLLRLLQQDRKRQVDSLLTKAAQGELVPEERALLQRLLRRQTLS